MTAESPARRAACLVEDDDELVVQACLGIAFGTPLSSPTKTRVEASPERGRCMLLSHWEPSWRTTRRVFFLQVAATPAFEMEGSRGQTKNCLGQSVRAVDINDITAKVQDVVAISPCFLYPGVHFGATHVGVHPMFESQVAGHGASQHIQGLPRGARPADPYRIDPQFTSAGFSLSLYQGLRHFGVALFFTSLISPGIKVLQGLQRAVKIRMRT